MRVLKLEMHLAHACNLRCEGCLHYSNYGLAGIVAFEDGRAWLEAWSARIQPVHFSFLGGEPLLNHELVAYLELTRELFPDSRLRLVTNGVLLTRWEALWPVLATTRTTLTISIHSRDPAYLDKITPGVEAARAAAARTGFTLDLRNSIEGWYMPYRGTGPTMEPFADGDPRASWKQCSSRHCVTLQDNALWKCPPLAHLPRVAARFGLGERASWAPYLAYRPLTLDATDDELMAFFGRGAETVCGMCPSRPAYFEKRVS